MTKARGLHVVAILVYRTPEVMKAPVDLEEPSSRCHRDKKAAKKFFRKLLKGIEFVPSVIITDKLKSYSAAKAEVMPSVEHLQQKYQNNRAENSHQSTRLREKVMRRFKSAGHAQRFLSSFGLISSHFRVGRHLCSANSYREVMRARFADWQDVTVA